MSTTVDVVFRSQVLVANGEQIQSDWLDVSRYPTFVLFRKMLGVGATYGIEVDWTPNPFEEPEPNIFTVTYTLNDTTAADSNIRQLSTLMPFVRFRIRNTGVAAFTDHDTVATFRGNQ